MVDIDKIKQLQRVTEALHNRELGKIRPILKEEAAVRRNIARLDLQAGQTAAIPPADLSMRSIGADVVWQSWLEKTRRQLNIELAQVMARKHALLDDVRKAFGKDQAMQSILAEAMDNRARRRRKRAQDSLLNDLRAGDRKVFLPDVASTNR